LLAGSSEIEHAFTLQESGNQDGLDWLKATPKAQDSSFRQDTHAFNAQAQLVTMELQDAYGRKTCCDFQPCSAIQSFPEQQFRFTPPVAQM